MEEQSIFKERESKAGPLIGSLIIIFVIIIGGLFFLSQKVEERKTELKKEEQEQNKLLSELDSIEQELNSSSTDELGKEISDIETEFDSN